MFCRGMISRSKVQMFSYDQLFQVYQKDKFVLVSVLHNRGSYRGGLLHGSRTEKIANHGSQK